MIKILPKEYEYNLSALLNKLKASQDSEKVKPYKCKKQRLETMLILIFATYNAECHYLFKTIYNTPTKASK